MVTSTNPVAASNKSRWLAAAVVATAALTIIAFSSAIRGPQLFDDTSAIQDNGSIRHLWPVSAPLHPPAGTSVAGRPLVNVSFAVNYWLNTALGIDQRADPQGTSKTVTYHAFNIVLHLCSGLLLLGILRRTLRTARVGGRWAADADAIALLITALWWLHPLHTDAVDYLIQRTELLVSFWFLATLYCSIRAWDAVTARGTRVWFCAGVVACACGMGSKEVMAGAPIIVALWDRAFRLDGWRDLLAPALRARRWFYGALAASWGILAAIMVAAPRGPSAGFAGGMPWYEYLYSQGWAISHYLRLVFWPVGLSIDYGTRPVAFDRAAPGLLLLAFCGAVTIWAWTRVRRWGWLGFVGAWFFVILAPSSSVVPVVTEIAAERRMYLPLAAVLVLLVVMATTMIRAAGDARARAPAARNGGPRWQRVAWGAAVGVAAALAALTYARGTLYRSPEAIWRDAAATVPDNGRAWYNLGVVLEHLPVPRLAAADSSYRKAVQLDPENADALLRLVFRDVSNADYAEAQGFLRQYPLTSGNDTVLARMGHIFLDGGDSIGALIAFRRVADQPSRADDLLALGQLYLAAGYSADAVAPLEAAVAMAPARTDLMVVAGDALIKQHHADRAAPLLEEAVRREPGSGVDLALLSWADADIGRNHEAVSDAARAVQLDSHNARVDILAGHAMLDDHRADLADTYLALAAALDPRNVDALTSLGEARLAEGDRTSAATLFERALAIDPRDSAARANLARR